jgi:uncharacterized membrane protein
MTQKGWIGIVILVVVFYFFGQISKPQDVNRETTANSAENAQSITADDIATLRNNALACKKTAGQAIQIDREQKPEQTMVILRTHFSETTRQCYYEVLTSDKQGSFTQTDIRMAPDDNWIAFCATASSKTICNERNHQGLITEEQYKALGDYYFGAP